MERNMDLGDVLKAIMQGIPQQQQESIPVGKISNDLRLKLSRHKSEETLMSREMALFAE